MANTGIPLDAELLCKAVREVLTNDLNINIQIIRNEWASAQDVSGVSIDADAMPEFIDFLENDIRIGRSDVVSTTSNFPNIQIFVEEEEPATETGGEQNWSPYQLSFSIRVIVRGLTVEHTEKLLYRYKDAVFRTMMQHRTLGGSLADIRPPHVFYAQDPTDPLYKAAQIQFNGDILMAW